MYLQDSSCFGTSYFAAIIYTQELLPMFARKRQILSDAQTDQAWYPATSHCMP